MAGSPDVAAHLFEEGLVVNHPPEVAFGQAANEYTVVYPNYMGDPRPVFPSARAGVDLRGMS